MRNSCVRGFITDPNSIWISYRRGRTPTNMSLNIQRAISSILGTTRCRSSYFYFCEIPNLAIFSFCDRFSIYDMYHRGVLPTFSIAWLNVHISVPDFDRLENQTTTTTNINTLFLKGG